MRSYAAAAILQFTALGAGAALHGRRIEGYTFPSNLTLADMDEWRHKLVPAFDLNPAEQNPESLAVLAKRDSEYDGYDTKIGLSEVQTDYGCDESIRGTLRDSIASLCNNGECTTGRSYTREVPIESEHYGSTRMGEIRVDISGTYDGNVCHYLIEATEETVQDETVGTYDHEYAYVHGGDTWMGTCRMSAALDLWRILWRR